MNQTNTRAKDGPSVGSIDAAHLRSIISRVHDPVVARLVIEHFEAHDLCESFPGAYMAARETVKRSQIRYAKARSMGRTTRAAGVLVARGTVAGGKALVSAVRSTVKTLRAMRRERQAAEPVATTDKVILLPSPRRYG